MSPDRTSSEDNEDDDHGHADHAGLRAGTAGLRQLLDDLSDTQPENEAPFLPGEGGGRIDQRESRDPVEPLAAVPALAFQRLALLARRSGAHRLAWSDDGSGERRRGPRLRRTTEGTGASVPSVGLEFHMPSLAPRMSDWTDRPFSGLDLTTGGPMGARRVPRGRWHFRKLLRSGNRADRLCEPAGREIGATSSADRRPD